MAKQLLTYEIRKHLLTNKQPKQMKKKQDKKYQILTILSEIHQDRDCQDLEKAVKKKKRLQSMS